MHARLTKRRKKLSPRIAESQQSQRTCLTYKYRKEAHETVAKIQNLNQIPIKCTADSLNYKPTTPLCALHDLDS